MQINNFTDEKKTKKTLKMLGIMFYTWSYQLIKYKVKVIFKYFVNKNFSE